MTLRTDAADPWRRRLARAATSGLASAVRRTARLERPVGNHTWSHRHLTELTDDELRALPATIDGLRARGFCLGVVHPSPTYHDQTRSYAEVGP